MASACRGRFSQRRRSSTSPGRSVLTESSNACRLHLDMLKPRVLCCSLPDFQQRRRMHTTQGRTVAHTRLQSSCPPSKFYRKPSACFVHSDATIAYGFSQARVRTALLLGTSLRSPIPDRSISLRLMICQRQTSSGWQTRRFPACRASILGPILGRSGSTSGF